MLSQTLPHRDTATSGRRDSRVSPSSAPGPSRAVVTYCELSLEHYQGSQHPVVRANDLHANRTNWSDEDQVAAVDGNTITQLPYKVNVSMTSGHYSQQNLICHVRWPRVKDFLAPNGRSLAKLTHVRSQQHRSPLHHLSTVCAKGPTQRPTRTEDNPMLMSSALGTVSTEKTFTFNCSGNISLWTLLRLLMFSTDVQNQQGRDREASKRKEAHQQPYRIPSKSIICIRILGFCSLFVHRTGHDRCCFVSSVCRTSCLTSLCFRFCYCMWEGRRAG